MNQQQQTMMGDREYLTDLLNTEKQIMGLYSTALIEASCPQLRQMLTCNFEETAQDQFGVFNNMHSRGFYETKQAQPQEVQQTVDKFSQVRNQI